MFKISKQLTCQKFIYKLHSSRLRKHRWRLTLPIEEARRNEEVISLADSQTLRWIDSLNNITDADAKAKKIKEEIRSLRTATNSVKNRHTVRKLYDELDQLQYKADYVTLIIDKEKDYYRAIKGFQINGVKYRRLLGTNGGIKNSTIVFVSENVADELHRRISNGRNPEKELVTAKLEAYQALTCSASTPVSFPKGIAVVDDCETSFLSDIVYLTDECDGEPTMELQKRQKVDLDATDGFGMMLPSLAERWSKELGLDYTISGANTRFSFEKGMAFTFDYVDFGEKIAGGKYILQDLKNTKSKSASVELSMEEFYAKAKNADYLIYNASIDSPIDSIVDLTAKSELFADFKAVKNGNVWCTGKSLYQATDIVGNLITDINLMLTDGDESGMTFLYQVK